MSRSISSTVDQEVPPAHTLLAADPAVDPHRHYAVAPVLGGVELLSAVYRAHRFSPHSQDAAVIGVVEQGSAMVFGAGERLTLEKGDVLVIPPQVLHDAYSIGTAEWHYRALYLTTAQIARITSDVTDGRGVLGTRPFVLEGGDIAGRVIAVHDSLRAAPPHSAALLGDMRALIHALDEGAASTVPCPTSEQQIAAGIARVRRTLDEDPLPKRSLTEMAQLAHRRIAAVRDLLMAGELVSRAAHHVGFADQSHLTRRFLSVVGVTPGEFRRAWQHAQVSASH
jgi:hypothetical protein